VQNCYVFASIQRSLISEKNATKINVEYWCVMILESLTCLFSGHCGYEPAFNSLKVSYNRVFGYYIEVSKANLALVPERYIRRPRMSPFPQPTIQPGPRRNVQSLIAARV